MTGDYEQQWFDYFIPGKLYEPQSGAFVDTRDFSSPFLFVEFTERKKLKGGIFGGTNPSFNWKRVKFLYEDRIIEVDFQYCPPEQCFKKISKK